MMRGGQLILDYVDKEQLTCRVPFGVLSDDPSAFFIAEKHIFCYDIQKA